MSSPAPLHQPARTAAATLGRTSRRRRMTDRGMRALLAVGTLAALVPLAFVLFYVIRRGAGAWSVSFFTEDPTGSFLGDPGGVRSAILGSLEMVALATAISVPIGIGVALYLIEYGRRGLFARTVRYFVDVMTGVPSIVFGLFVYIVLVLEVGGGFGGWKGSVALSLLMIPMVTRSAEVVLRLVPGELREAALALGAPRWRVIARVVLPTALPGLLTGSLLAIARGFGETAPLLFTATLAKQTTFDLSARMNSLPVQIFSWVGQPNDRLVNLAWGAALLLVVLVLAIMVVSRLIARRSSLT